MTESSPSNSTRDETPLPPSSLVKAPAQPEPKPDIPGYEILEELGRGGMGVVYKARQLNLNRIVALKVIRRDRLAQPDTVRRFRREVQAIARLSHPHLVVVHHADQLGDTHYFAMEYIDGVTLQRLVQEEGPLPIATACDYIRQAALGLQHAHERRLVHRDIKPANLMVLQESGIRSQESRVKDTAFALTPDPRPLTPVVKILDLGMARLLQPLDTEESVSSTLTEAGAVIGTLDYIAPEQARDPRTADIRADLYSLGCTLHFLLTGQVLYPGGTWLDKLDKHRNEPPPRVPTLRPGVPIEVSNIMQRLLAKKPEERYQSPAELATALERWCDPQALVAAASETPVSGETVDFAATPPPLSGPGADAELARLKTTLESQLRRGDFREARDTVSAMLRLRPGDWEALAARAAIDKYSGASDYVGEQRRLMGHGDWVTSATFSPDGRQALSASRDGTLRLWDLESGQELRTLHGHTSGVTCVAWIEGNSVASGGQDRVIRLWDVGSGAEVRRFEGHRERVWTIAVAADRRWLLSGGGALGPRKDNALRLWNLDTGKELARFLGHTDQVNCVVFAADQQHILSGGNDGTLRLWDLKSGKETHCLQGHVGAIWSLALSADGRRVLYAGESVRLLDLPSDGEECWLFHHPETVTSVALSADGKQFLSGCLDMVVRLWDTDSGRLGREEEQQVLGVRTTVRVWEPDRGKPPHRYEGHLGRVNCVALSRDGRRALSGSADRTVRLWGLPESIH
jgi:serine/threonine protein kinase